MEDCKGKIGRRPKLTPEVQKKIVEYVRGGAYEYIAAMAAGISKSTFYGWVRRGEAAQALEDTEQSVPEDEQPYLDFVTELNIASAQARVVAEVEVRRTNPLAWLMKGKGREKAGEPGWTNQTEVTGPGGKSFKIVLGWEGDDTHTLAAADVKVVEDNVGRALSGPVASLADDAEFEDIEDL